MTWIVDRIEGDLAVLEGPTATEERAFTDVPLDQLPEGVREGSRVDRSEGQWVLLPDDPQGDDPYEGLPKHDGPLKL